MSQFGIWIAKYWLQVLFGIIASMLTVFGKMLSTKIKNVKKEQKAINGAILALLRDRINQSCQYHLTQNKITNRDYQVLDAMFTQYFAMGGNGVVHRLKQEIDKLPMIVQVNN